MNKLSPKNKQRLLNTRELLFNNPKNFGKVVYDKKNEEYGIVVGEIKYKDEEDSRILVVTLDTESGGSRVRYTRQRNLIIIKDQELNDDTIGNVGLDLKSFCKDQCLFECDKDCILFKYKNKKI